MSILGLGSRLNRLICLGFVLCLLLPAIVAQAAPWRFARPLAEDKELRLLFERYPAIDSAEDLQNLLKETTHSKPFLSLEAYFVDGYWEIDGEMAEYIKDMQINLITRKLDAKLEVVRQKYLGRVDSIAIRRKVIDSVLEILQGAGYTNASIRFHTYLDSDGLSYIMNIDEDEACLISKINLPFRLPSQLSFPIKAGDICDSEVVNSEIDQLEDELRVAGYREISLNFDGFTYNRDKKFAEVNISGDLGKKVIYRIVDEGRFFLVDDLFADHDLEGVDLIIGSPEVMKGEIRKYYTGNGYEDVQISEPATRVLADDTMEYTYHVSSGPQYYVTNVQFEGNSVFDRDELLDASELYNFWNSRIIFNRDEVNEAIDRILNVYQEQGYWDARISSPRITKDRATASVMVVITIQEGKPRKLERVQVTGNRVFTAGELTELLPINKGDIVNKALLLQFEENIREQYVKLGYAYNDVQISINSYEELHDLPTVVNVKIVEGTRVTIGKINIVGLIKTDMEVVSRELLFKTGDWYNPEVITASRSALMSLGMFRSVQIVPADRIAYLDKAQVLDIVVEVYEGKAGNIAFGPGYNLIRGLNYTTEFSYNNLAGTGRQVSLKAAVSQEKNQYTISDQGSNRGATFLGRKIGVGYVEPYLFGWPVDGNVNVTHKGVAEEIWQINNTLDLSMVYKPRTILADSLIVPFYNLQLNRDEGTREQKERFISTGDTRIARMGLRFRWDRRDQISWPTAGYLVSTETSWARYALGGEYRFFKWDVGFSFYLSASDRVVWANSVGLTSYDDVQRKSPNRAAVLPSLERLKAGGANRVRGFQHQLGPYVNSADGRDPIGGTKRSIFKTELRYKVSDDIGLAAFVDSGNTFFSEDEVSRFRAEFERTSKDGEMRTIEDNIGYGFNELLTHPGYLVSRHYLSYGGAFNLITPVGPIYVSLSWPWKEPTSERCSKSGVCFSRAKQESNWLLRSVFDLSIGTEF